jgi:hypothetical protein
VTALNIGTARDGRAFTLPLEVVTTSLAILAKKRVGKSYTAAVIAEELMTAGQPVVIVDITGAHWGLKSSANGSKAMFPVVIFGGRHADVPLEENAGKVIAAAVVEKRFSAILDFSIMSKAGMKRFLLAFMEELYRINQEPIHLICDEADRYAPQKPDGDDAKLIAAMDDIVSRGGIKGIGVSLITQRSAKLNKNILTQCELLIALRIVHPLDAKSVMEWIEMHATESEAKEMLESLPTLPIGTGWFWWPNEGERDIFERVRVRPRRTFDSGATPKAGVKVEQPRQLASVDVAQLGADIASCVQRAKDNDPAALRAEIARLKGEVQRATRAQLAAELATPKMPERVFILSDEQTRLLNQVRDALTQAERGVTERTKVIEFATLTLQSINSAVNAIHGKDATAPAPLVIPGCATREQAVRAGRSVGVVWPDAAPNRPEVTVSKNGVRWRESDSLSSPQRKLLTILAQNPEGCRIEKLALLGGYRIGGGFRNLFSQMRTAGWIDGENTGTMTITKSGREALGDFDPLPTGSALGRYWLESGRLGGPEKRILQMLLDDPNGFTMEQIAGHLDYRIGGGFRNLFSKLRTAGLIVGSNTERMRAHPELFD